MWICECGNENLWEIPAGELPPHAHQTPQEERVTDFERFYCDNCGLVFFDASNPERY